MFCIGLEYVLKDKTYTYNLKLKIMWGGKKARKVFMVWGASVSPSELQSAINSISVRCDVCMHEKNQTLFATHGTTFKAWIQIHGKLEAVSAALAVVILNDL
jgi:hypothetical protein